jgi:dTDP-4-dehydrorhamnose 3,5-epimerase-like enzyme
MNGVIVTPIKQIPDERGTVRKFITNNDIPDFAECYTTTIYKGVIKGLHGYYSKTIHYCVPVGLVKLVVWDAYTNEVQEIFVGTENFVRVTIAPKIMNAFQGIADVSLAVVVADEQFDENKTIRMPWNDPKFPYDWSKIK